MADPAQYRASADTARLELVQELAQEAFWAKVAECYPEATHGDWPPNEDLALTKILESAIKLWLELNVDPEPEEPSWEEILKEEKAERIKAEKNRWLHGILMRALVTVAVMPEWTSGVDSETRWVNEEYAALFRLAYRARQGQL